MKKETFKEYLKAHIERAEKSGATCSEFEKVKKVKSEKAFLKILAANIKYLFNKNIVELEHLQFFEQKQLLEVGIYITGNHSIEKDTVFVGGNATIQDVWGNATIQDVWGNATIQDVWGNATIRNIRDNATIQDVRDNATIRNIRDNATIQDVWGNATIRNIWGNATIRNIWGNATIRNIWGNAENVKNISGNAIMRSLSENKIYIKKGQFEIVEL